VIVEVYGLEVFGHHGAGEEERERGQAFFFDVTLEIAEPHEDELEATLDYRAIRDAVREVSGAKSYKLIESLAAAAADDIASRLGIESVTVRVRKPGIAWAAWTAATASRDRRS
jgi:7,8-dihydroneopterin aldolase/epimerase/oxygenase